MRKSFLYLFLLLVSQLCFAQQPDYVGPSPQAATFLKYRDYPVDLSTGLVDITVPLLSLDLKSYQLPISAKFHASGRRIDMSYSELGMNWKLEAFGMITREVRGVSDWLLGNWSNSDMEHSGDYYRTLSSDDEGLRFQKLMRRSSLDGSNGQPTNDSEYDIFTVSFGGISSTFIMRGYEVVFLDYFPYKVIYDGVFTLTDDKGIQYTFGSIIENNLEYGSEIGFNNSQIAGGMSWYLAKILTPQQDYFRFKYNRVASDGFFLGGNISYGTRATLGDSPALFSPSGDSQGIDYMNIHGQVFNFSLTNTSQNESQSIAYVTEIESPIGNVAFLYNTPNYSLNEIQMRSSNNNILKRVKFYYQDVMNLPFTLPNNQNKTLSEVSFMDTNSQNPNSYKMEYYTGYVPMPQSISEYCYGRDYWGYANTNRNWNIIPINQVVERIGIGSTIVTNRTIGGDASRRNPEFESKRVGMLKKLIYPTGGFAEFFYESNRFRTPGTSSTEEGPGLRITQVKHVDGSNTINKHYKYGDNEDGVGVLLRKPSPFDFQTSQLVSDIPALNGAGFGQGGSSYTIQNGFRYRFREFYSDPVGPIRPAYNVPVYYNNVTEYQKDELGNNLGKTTYYFASPTFNVERNEFYDSNSGDHYDLSRFVPMYFSKSRLMSTNVYSMTNNTYNLLKNTVYAYSLKRITEMPQVAYYRRHKIISNISNGSENYDEVFVETKLPYDYGHYGSDFAFPWNTIAIRDYKLISATMVQDSIVETDYSPNGIISKSTSYLYESSYTNKPSTISERDSKDNYNVTKIIYPDDISSTQSLSGGVISAAELQAFEAMKKGSGNFASIPIQIESYSSSSILKDLNRSHYKLVSGIPSLYQKSDKKIVNDALSTAYEILLFDNKGNPLQVRDKQQALKSYIWGYNGQFPVAVIHNATYSEVLNILGQNTINSLNDVNVSDQTINTAINNLRNHSGMSQAMVTAYTYKPLVGMTSQTDPKGMTTYFEYDSFQRLKHIKDQNGNIVKSYCYNYAGQVSDCNVGGNTGNSANWVNTGMNSECETQPDPFFNNQPAVTGNMLIEQVDNNPNSPTYNTTRKITDPTAQPGSCPPSYYYTTETDPYLSSVTFNAKRSYDDGTTKTMRFRVRHDSVYYPWGITEEYVDIQISSSGGGTGYNFIMVNAASYLEVELMEVF